ncbi:MAG: two pore domain potassium channel family protein [Verrucomicrobia bacterium]|nr:two pore domain potassium channel family protein [Verrucomicrobiota bacterium]
MNIHPAPHLAAAAAISAADSGIPRGQYLVALLSVVLVIVCVLLHYEVLRKLSTWLARLKQLHRTRVLVLILGLLGTHLVEIWVYALGFGLLDGVADFGRIAHFQSATTQSNWLDYVYYSFVTYTTVGYGDIVPVGPIRFIAATEALNGWVLLGWSASFTFLEMQRFWREPGK